MKKLGLVLILLATLFGTAGARADTPANGPLAAYLANDDASFAWVERQSGKLGDTEYVELTLTSQTWRDVPWKHRLFIIKPPNVDPEARHGFMFVTGGRWKDEYEGPINGNGLPKSAPLFARAAALMGTPVAILLQVPRQPLFEGRTEDALIALTFQRYLETGDPEWPLLLPMVKSAVRGMDAIQAYAREAWSLELDTFTVSGASKRGWTTWLTGAADPRVTAIAPMVIDVLNMGPQLVHQREVWGDISVQIGDYTELRLHEQLETERGRELLAIVDPYRYRAHLNEPKLIIVGTNDPYWPIDALNLYWDDLPGEKYILYVPNQGHRVQDYHRLVGGLNALHQHVAKGRRLPALSWDFENGADSLGLRVRSDRRPDRVTAWIAHSPTRDFRQAEWKPYRFGMNGRDVFSYDLPLPESGYTAIFGEAAYGQYTPAPFFLSTNVRVIGAEGQAAGAERKGS